MMKGKSVILSVLIMSLVMAQIQVEAGTLCCISPKGRDIFELCMAFYKQDRCEALSGCIVTNGNSCPPDHPNDGLENSGDAVSEYCKLGCEFSMCISLTTLQKSDASEIVTGAVEKCAKACSTLCTKGSNLKQPKQSIVYVS